MATSKITSLKIRRALYTIIGSLLIVLNFLVDIATPDRSSANTENQAYNRGYMMGSHLLAFIGLLLLLFAFRLNKKIKCYGTNTEIEKSIEELGKNGEA